MDLIPSLLGLAGQRGHKIVLARLGLGGVLRRRRQGDRDRACGDPGASGRHSARGLQGPMCSDQLGLGQERW